MPTGNTKLREIKLLQIQQLHEDLNYLQKAIDECHHVVSQVLLYSPTDSTEQIANTINQYKATYSLSDKTCNDIKVVVENYYAQYKPLLYGDKFYAQQSDQQFSEEIELREAFLSSQPLGRNFNSQRLDASYLS